MAGHGSRTDDPDCSDHIRRLIRHYNDGGNKSGLARYVDKSDKEMFII